MTDQELSLQSLHREIHATRQEVARLSGDVRDLIEAWNTARGLVKFVKMIGALAVGISAIWALWRIGK